MKRVKLGDRIYNFPDEATTADIASSFAEMDQPPMNLRGGPGPDAPPPALQPPPLQTGAHMPRIPPPRPPGGVPNVFKDALGIEGAFAQGATFSHAPEATGMLYDALKKLFPDAATKLSGGEATGAEVAEFARSKLDQFAKEHPVEDMAGKIAGSSIYPIATGVRGVAQLGAMGALNARGENRDPARMDQDMLIGGLLGSAVPAAISTVGGVGGWAANTSLGREIRSHLPGFSPGGADEAKDIVIKGARRQQRATQMEMLERARTGVGPPPPPLERTPEAAVRTMVSEANRNKTAMIADTGDKMQSLARAVAVTPSEGSSIVKQTLADRARRAPATMADHINETLGLSGVSAGATKDALTASQKARAAPIFRRADAYKMQPNAHLDSILNSPQVKPMIARGLQNEQGAAIAANRAFDPADFGVTYDKAGKMVIGDVPRLSLIKMAKEEIDTEINAARDAVTGKINWKGRSDLRTLDKMRRSMLDILDGGGDPTKALNPHYARARAIYAGEAENKDAVDAGLAFARGSEYDLANRAGDMTPGQHEHFTIGVGQHLRDSALKPGDVSNVIRHPKVESRLRASLGDDVTNQLIDHAESIGRQNTTRNMALSGSATAPILADLGDVADTSQVGRFGGAVQSLSKGDWGAGLAKLLSIKGSGRMPEQTADALADMLTRSTPQELRLLYDDLNQHLANKRLPKLVLGARAGRAAAAVGVREPVRLLHDTLRFHQGNQ